jgi:hypothetical protein
MVDGSGQTSPRVTVMHTVTLHLAVLMSHVHHPMTTYKVTLHLMVLTSHVHLPKATRKVTVHLKVLTSHAHRPIVLREVQELVILQDLIALTSCLHH